MSQAVSRLIICCLLLRALVPVGFMPDLGAARDGVFTIVICTAAGLSTVAVDEDGNPVAPHPSSEADRASHCLFAPAGSIALPTVIVPTVPHAVTAATGAWLPIEAVRHTRFRPTSSRPRAPPIIS